MRPDGPNFESQDVIPPPRLFPQTGRGRKSVPDQTEGKCRKGFNSDSSRLRRRFEHLRCFPHATGLKLGTGLLSDVQLERAPIMVVLQPCVPPH